jgi:hypothetical protein
MAVAFRHRRPNHSAGPICSMIPTTLSAPDPPLAVRGTPPAPRRSTGQIWFAALATALIFNSHLELLQWRHWLAGDGLLGNSMFLFLTAWGVARSWQREPRPFGAFMTRRLLRIYPMALLSTIIIHWALVKGWQTWPLERYRYLFLYPTPFTFIKLIVPMYGLQYVALRWLRLSLWPWLIVGLGIVYLGFWVNQWNTFPLSGMSLGLVRGEFHFLYYGAVMALGGWWAYRPDSAPSAQAKIPVIALGIGMTTLYLVAKILLVRWDAGRAFPLLHGLCFLAMIPLWQCLALLSNWVNTPWLHTGAQFIASRSWDIYVVHAMLLGLPWWTPELQRFPIGIILLATATLLVGDIFRRLITRFTPLSQKES